MSKLHSESLRKQAFNAENRGDYAEALRLYQKGIQYLLNIMEHTTKEEKRQKIKEYIVYYSQCVESMKGMPQIRNAERESKERSEEKEEKWMCMECTTINSGERNTCKTCDGRKTGYYDGNASNSKYKIVIGIDFGTHGTGVAYSIRGTKKVDVLTRWNDERIGEYDTSEKAKTSILLKRKGDNEYETIAFGKTAEVLSARYEDAMLFERFKMKLFTSGDLEKKIPTHLSATNSKDQVETKHVFVDALTHIIRRVIESIERNAK